MKKLAELTRVCKSDLYKPTIGKSLIQHMANGNSLTSFLFKMGITKIAFDYWIKRYPEFKDAYEIAKMGEQSAWEEMARQQASGETKGSGTTLQFMMKNRFSDTYKDKQEVEHNTNVVFHIDTGILRPGDDGYSDSAIEVDFSKKPEIDEIDLDDFEEIETDHSELL